MRYFFEVKSLSPEEISNEIRSEHTIRFVSLVAVDMGNNHTDEKIPVSEFLENIHNYLDKGIQTDGSSVVLPKIAEINDARVDLIPDRTVRWYVDYSMFYRSLIDGEMQPVGTLVIPSFIYHNGVQVGSRGVLKRACDHFKTEILDLYKEVPHLFQRNGIPSIKDVRINLATELEFWVESLHVSKDEESLFVSQELKEQYWKRPSGALRHAMEECLMMMEEYGLRPEMGHKEVGGVGSKLEGESTYTHMEQIEIDWYFGDAMQALDNELIIKDMVMDIFNRHGLDVTFKAKPMEGVAGSGEHHHVSVTIIDEAGKAHNLFAPNDTSQEYLSELGFGALMGILKHYNIIQPFISYNIDALNRLKPGFEAPVSTVCSLGESVLNATRNRSVLICVCRDLEKPMSYRFELRSPNPSSNSYLLSAAVLSSMLDGMQYAKNQTNASLEAELSKLAGEEANYLHKDRQYRSEEDIYTKYNVEERALRFGPVPKTVYEVVQLFREGDAQILTSKNIFTQQIIESFMTFIIDYWKMEVRGRLIPEEINILRSFKNVHENELDNEVDIERWQKIASLRKEIMKDTPNQQSMISLLEEAIDKENLKEVSELQYRLQEDTRTLKRQYLEYKRNLIEY